MKNLMMIAAAAAWLSACTPKTEQGADKGWPELDGFHDVMAAVYHPVADSGNMEPARNLASKLDSAARVLASSAVPSDRAGEDTQMRLTVLRDSSNAFLGKVNAGSPDSVLRPSITKLHHVFHELMEGGHGKHH